MAHALIVDDEADLCRLMQITLGKMGIDTTLAYDLNTAKQALAAQKYDFCLTDLALPDGNGLDLVRLVGAYHDKMPIAVITAHGNVDVAIEALKLGAFDFVNKPLEITRLRDLVNHALKIPQKDATSPEDEKLDARLIGKSEPMAHLRGMIKKVARSQAPVFLWGASGTGKEVVARLIHDLSPRAQGNFVAVNCGAIPSELMESEFFGHKKGSFTGATHDKIGLFQQAHGGTLFLDEVADLPLAMQVKLLRAIQEKTVRAIGDTMESAVDIRLLSATHKNLAALVASGDFRQDLYYRINVIEVKLPSLNERRDDIDALAAHFLAIIASDWGMAHTPTLSPRALERLRAHSFEGNVRELRNILERAVTLSDSEQIDAEALQLTTPDSLDTPHQGMMSAPVPQTPQVMPMPAPMPNTMPITPSAPTYQHPNPSAHIEHLAYAIPHAQSQHRTPLPQEGLEEYLMAQERQLIEQALIQAGGNKTRAAALLGTSFRSLRYRMKKLGVGDDDSC